MVKVIMGIKGSGKTKQLIEMVKTAIEAESGDVVVLEKDQKLTYDIPYKARLIFANQFSFGSFEFLKGFISGLHAGNYDITHIFIESLNKILKVGNMEEIEEFLCWCDAFGNKENVKFTITISDDENNATEKMKEYMI